MAEKLQQLRGGRSYSSIAREVDCSTNAIRDLEARRTSDPSVRLIGRLAELYSVTVDWLIDDSVGWPPPETPEQSAEVIVREALTGAGLAGKLNEEERKLLARYRALNPLRKPKLEGFIEGLGGDSDRRTDNNPQPQV
ncbi:MAG: helix-turn-helix transcriptional regulator [Phycisphaerae bacterium]|nr:helix-turn-helix transcriptional regulator [Phycisphaerae bacterium]